MRRVLLLNSGKDRATELLAAEPGVELAIVAKARYAERYRRFAAVELVADLADVGAVTGAALRLARGGTFDAVVAPVEAAVMPAGFLRSFLGVPGQTLDQVLPLTSKLHMKRRLAAAGVATPPAIGVSDLDGLAEAAPHVGWPMVVKPMLGAGGVNTHVIASPNELAGLRASGALDGLEQAACPLVAEGFVTMRQELHCDGVVAGGSVEFAAVSRYLSPLLGARRRGVAGSYTLPEAGEDALRVRRLHAETVAALGLRDGVTHMECLDDGSRLLVGEIACRPAGAGIVPAVERRHGVDLWQAFVDCALERRPRVRSRDRGLFTGWLGLPGQNGVVREITTADTLASVPGVDRVTVFHRPGQHVHQTVSTTFFSVQVEFTLPASADIDALVGEVRRRHRLAVEPEPAAAVRP
ncbi:MAG TPA: hypothetical protein VOB72_21110 [Candidatus Dormibacteraeota bacterium]|nr:hypothetical protein [Candidatus Dormibacteraeota bacterium]